MSCKYAQHKRRCFVHVYEDDKIHHFKKSNSQIQRKSEKVVVVFANRRYAKTFSFDVSLEIPEKVKKITFTNAYSIGRQNSLHLPDRKTMKCQRRKKT